MTDWRTDYADQNVRLAQKMLEQQGEVNRLAAELAAANAALTAVTDLLDEARTERDEAWTNAEAALAVIEAKVDELIAKLNATEMERDEALARLAAEAELVEANSEEAGRLAAERDDALAEVARYRAELRGMGRAVVRDGE